MVDRLSLCLAFALLLGLQAKSGAAAGRMTYPLSLFPILREGMDLFRHIAFLLFLYLLVVEYWVPLSLSQELYLPCLLPLSYLAAKAHQKSAYFFLTSFSFSFFIVQHQSAYPFWTRLLDTVLFSAGVTLFRIFFTSVRKILVFS